MPLPGSPKVKRQPENTMKTKSIMAQVLLVVVLVTAAKAGPLEFMRDQLGITATNYPFGSSPSAFPEFQPVKGVKPGSTEALYEFSPRAESAQTNSIPVISSSKPGVIEFNFDASFQPPTIRLHFTDDKLDWIETWSGGKKRNDRLLAEFIKLSGNDPKVVAEAYQYRDEHYQLTYRGLCSPA